MRNVWKWILGVALALVVCGALGGVGFLFMRNYGLGMVRAPLAVSSGPASGSADGRWSMPMHRDFAGPDRDPQMWMYPHAGMRGWLGSMPFGMGFMFLGGLFRLLLPLGLIALVALGGYALGRRSAVRSAGPKATPIPESPPPPSAQMTGHEGEETPK